MSQTERKDESRPRERRSRPEIPPERRSAALAQVRTLGDPVLRETARPVETFDDELAALSRRMIAVMRDAPGIGLAATQLGIVKRVIVYQVDDDPVTLVNPRIVRRLRRHRGARRGLPQPAGRDRPGRASGRASACALATFAVGASNTTPKTSRPESSSTRSIISTAC